MDQTNVMTYFEIRGDYFSIEYVTEILGISPTKSFLKGEEINRTNNSKTISTKKRFRTYTCWQLGTDYVETLYANKQAKELIRNMIVSLF